MLEMIPDKRLIERDMGELEGKSRDEYDFTKFWDYNLNSGDLGVERVQDIFKRCRDVLNYIIKKHPGKDILIVSHGAPVRAMHHLLRNSDLNGNLRRHVTVIKMFITKSHSKITTLSSPRII